MWIKLIVVAILMMGICSAELEYPSWGEYYIHRAVIERVDDDHIQVTLEMENLAEGGPLAAEGEVLVQISDKIWWRDPTFGFYSEKDPRTGMWNEVDTSKVPPPKFHNESFTVKKSDFVGRDPKWISPPIQGNTSECFVISFKNEGGNTSKTTPLVKLSDDGWSVIGN